jgi:hypothetical protein
VTGVSDERWEQQKHRRRIECGFDAAEWQRRNDVRIVRELAKQFKPPLSQRLRLLALDLLAWAAVAAAVYGYLYWASGQIR